MSGENADHPRPVFQSIAIQTLETTETLPISAEAAIPPSEPKWVDIVAYSKGVQTDGLISPSGDYDAEDSSDELGTTQSRKCIELQEEEIRNKLRKEIEDEVQAASSQRSNEDIKKEDQSRYPLRTLSENELKAVTSSDDFFDFVERSTRVIERALDEDYDVLADYELGGLDGDPDEEEAGYGKKKRSIKEVSQFWDERWSKKRMISDLGFSPKVSIDRIIIMYLDDAYLD